MPSYARRRDANQSELDEAARRLGWTVLDTSGCAAYKGGFPDAIWSRDGLNLLVEYKTDGGEFTPAERLFQRELPGPYEVCYSVDDVEDITRRWWPGRIG